MPAPVRTCSVTDCTNPIIARGWCHAHYSRWRRLGDVQADRPLKSPRGGPPPCGVDGCDRPRHSRGWCAMHYKRWQRTGDPLHSDDRPAECAVGGCDLPVDGRGLCHGHLQRLLRTGDVEADTPLGRRRQPEICTIEGCDRPTNSKRLCRAHRNREVEHGDPFADLPIATPSGEGYVHHGYFVVPVPVELRHLSNGQTSYPEHRLIMATYLGRPLAPDEVVHHRNGDKLDNRIENLELWSTYQPKGQRIADKVAYSLEIIRRYPDHVYSCN